jgi:hypothetical protein
MSGLEVETINRILSLSAPNISEHNELEYTDKPLSLILAPQDDSVVVTTLSGLSDLIKADVGQAASIPSRLVLHIDTPTSVRLLERDPDKWGRRQIVASAVFPKSITPFRFGAWHDPENFIIGVQSGFQSFFVDATAGQMASDLDYVLKVASNITAESSTINADDGISQNVTLQKGIALKDAATLKGRVKLAPYRTFTEIAQVVSDFVFRVRTDGDDATLALFEADGGRWQLEAAKAIADWLTEKTTGIPILR